MARHRVIRNIGMPKITVYFCLRCFRASYLAFICCLRRLQALASPVSYSPAVVTTLVYWDWLGWRQLSCMVLCFELTAEAVLITQQ